VIRLYACAGRRVNNCFEQREPFIWLQAAWAFFETAKLFGAAGEPVLDGFAGEEGGDLFGLPEAGGGLLDNPVVAAFAGARTGGVRVADDGEFFAGALGLDAEPVEFAGDLKWGLVELVPPGSRASTRTHFLRARARHVPPS